HAGRVLRGRLHEPHRGPRRVRPERSEPHRGIRRLRLVPDLGLLTMETAVTPTTRNLKALGYIGAVAAGAALLLGSSLGHIVRGAHDKHLLAWAVLAVLTLVAGRLSVRLAPPSRIVAVADALIVLTVLRCRPRPETL